MTLVGPYLSRAGICGNIKKIAKYTSRFSCLSNLNTLSSTKNVQQPAFNIKEDKKLKNLAPRRSFASKNLEFATSQLNSYSTLLRIDKPIGTLLLAWPCTWGISLAGSSGHFPDLYLLSLFGAGACLMRGAGCIINDMWDRDFDKKVARTKTRPLASGELSMAQATGCLGLTLALSLGILLQLNWYSVFVGAASLCLVIIYPYMKRITYWPQLTLGFTFNYGILLGWTAVQGSLDLLPVLPMYAGAVCWTLIYDTIYAHQDKEDDIMIGVKSTALRFGDDTKYWLTGFSGLMVTGLLTTGYITGQFWPYYVAVAGTVAHLSYQITSVDLNNSDDCGRKFRSNTWIGAMIFAGIVGSKLLQPPVDQSNVVCGNETELTKHSFNTQDNAQIEDKVPS